MSVVARFATPILRLMGALSALVCMTTAAYATEVELWPETYFQVAQYRDIDRLKIDETRFTQTLTFNLFQTGPEPQHAFLSSMRLDFDAGFDSSKDASLTTMPPHRFAVLYGYYQGRRLGDWVDVAVGRQLLSDELGFLTFDGARVTIYNRGYLGADLYAGSELRGALSEKKQSLFLPNSDTFELDGLKSEARTRGVMGAALFLRGLPDTQLRLQYRHYLSDDRTDAQTFGLAFRQRIFGVWNLDATSRYDLLFLRFAQLDVGTELAFRTWRLRLEHTSHRASYDAASIFNFFAANSTKALQARLFWAPLDGTTLTFGYAHQHQGDASPVFDAWGHRGNASDEIQLDATQRLPAHAEIHGGYHGDVGWGGDTHLARLGASISLFGERWRLSGDASGKYFSRLLYTDILEANRNHGVSYGFSLQSRLRFNDEIMLTNEAEALSGPYVERQFRIFTLLEVHAWL